MAFGVLTTNSAEEAIERVGPGPANKGWEAAVAAIEMATLFAGTRRRPGGAPRERTRRRAGAPCRRAARRPRGRAADALSVGGRAPHRARSAPPVLGHGRGRGARLSRAGRDRLRPPSPTGPWSTSAEIDPLIEESAENWRLDRMPVIDRLILRLGRLRAAAPGRDAAAGRHRRGAGAGEALQHAGGREVHQRRARRRSQAPAPRQLRTRV